MACPTCDHTMQNIGHPGHRVFWCPKCGTYKMVRADDGEDISKPALAERARNLQDCTRSPTQAVTVDKGFMFVEIPLHLWLAVMEAAGVNPETVRTPRP